MINTQNREHYLDNLRWIAMLLGVFVHTSKLDNFGFLDQIAEVSNLFRMALFFLISGYLGALLLSKKSNLDFLKSRLANLTIPLAAGILILNPITFLLMHQYIDGNPSFDRAISVYSLNEEQRFKDIIIVWHLHLWFLFSLIFYVLMATLIKDIIKKTSSKVQSYILDRPAVLRNIHAITISFIIITSIFTIIIFKCIESFTGNLPWIIRITFQYIPFYITGMIIFYCKTLFINLRKTNYVLGFIIIFTYIIFNHMYTQNSTLSLITLICARTWICFFMLDLGYKFLNIKNKATTLLSESIYTVYIFHFIVIYILATLLTKPFEMNILDYVTISVITISICIMAHIYLIKKSNLALLVFNGRLKKAKETSIIN
ncbi:Glucans biosynthesis protein C [Nitrincola lacisaponensis]|uniref:Glucans biosynthesis protein C n=1 Tax=Nitrincola lacisaponensis TaxID=267850 RepID=A0A063Y256_9GAMM|nr:acyltransferase family protein [Nitrincola lacisaponensis]KDE39245.1 Glucans biosynthesis protein C [Nitrincola lacisaponensis]